MYILSIDRLHQQLEIVIPSVPIFFSVQVIGMTETNGITTSVLQDRNTRAKQIVDQAVDELAADLERGQSETLKRYLAFMGRFHRLQHRQLPPHLEPNA
jgi:hypothetical protein